MTKKFVPVICKKKTHRLYQEDIKKIYYMNKVQRPSLPKFESNESNDERLRMTESVCLESDNETCIE